MHVLELSFPDRRIYITSFFIRVQKHCSNNDGTDIIIFSESNISFIV